jgi:acyl-CoA thioester hydrolase
MPLTYQCTFRVRHYECDAYGHVNNANYLRYMQEAAFDASAAAGYDYARYQQMGTGWLIRETDIEYLRPLRYGDSVAVTTWVADFQRVRSRRDYTMSLAGTGEPVARAHTDWVYLNHATGRPAAIPPEMVLAFCPEGAPSLPRPRVSTPAAPPSGTFRMRRRARWQDLDPAEHVNNAVYLSYIEDGGIQALAARGWPLDRLAGLGLGIVARRIQIEYRAQAVLDDELEIATWVTDVRNTSAIRHHVITRVSDGAVVTVAQVHGVWVNLATGRPTRMPADYRAEVAPSGANEGT